MKFFSIFLAFFIMIATAFSQITINSNDIPLQLNAPVYFKALDNASLLLIKNNTNPGPAQTWDFTGITVDNTLIPFTDNSIPVNSPYPDASYWYNYSYSIFGYNIPSKEYEKKDDTGIYALGFTLDSMYLDLTVSIPGSYAIIPNQKVDYVPEYQKIKFPLEYNYPSVDTTYTKREIKGLLTLPSIGLSNADVGYQISYMRTVSQIGWGTIKLHGYKTDPEVLLVQINEVMVDSLFINGTPAPDQLLAGTGLSQGHTYSYNTVLFYAKGYPTYLLKAYMYFDNGVPQPQYANGYLYMNPDTTGVNDLDIEPVNTTAYPNPVSDNLNIRFNKTTDATWTLNFYNSNGMMVKSLNLNNPAGDVTIDVNFGNETPNGVYFYNITDNSMNSRYRGKVVVVR